MAVDTHCTLDTLHWDRGVLSCLMPCVSSVKTVTMLLQSRAVFTLGVRMCSTGVTRAPLLNTIRPNSGIVIAVLFMSNVLLLMCQNKPTTKLFHSSRQLHYSNWAHIYLDALIICTFSFADMLEFREIFSKAKHIAIITGAGVSAESGVPTFRGENEKWRKWLSQVLEKQNKKKNTFI